MQQTVSKYGAANNAGEKRAAAKEANGAASFARRQVCWSGVVVRSDC